MTSETLIESDKIRTESETGVFIRTETNEIEALVNNGILEIREANDIELTRVINNDGTIRVIAGGTIRAIEVESKTDKIMNNVGIISEEGDK